MEDKDHDLLIEVRTVVSELRSDISELKDKVASKDSVQRAHERIDTLQKYLIGVAAFAAVEAFAIIKMLLIK